MGLYEGDHLKWIWQQWTCGGSTGWLCDRCREDRADARVGLRTKLVTPNQNVPPHRCDHGDDDAR
jgi:hypothetical protein